MEGVGSASVREALTLPTTCRSAPSGALAAALDPALAQADTTTLGAAGTLAYPGAVDGAVDSAYGAAIARSDGPVVARAFACADGLAHGTFYSTAIEKAEPDPKPNRLVVMAV